MIEEDLRRKQDKKSIWNEFKAKKQLAKLFNLNMDMIKEALHKEIGESVGDFINKGKKLSSE